MGRMGRFDCKGLKDFQQQLGKLQNPDDFVESCAKELAARLLRMVVKRTPVGQYPAIKCQDRMYKKYYIKMYS